MTEIKVSVGRKGVPVSVGATFASADEMKRCMTEDVARRLWDAFYLMESALND